MAGRSPSDLPARRPRRGAEVAGIGVWLVLPRGRSNHDGAEGGQARPEVGAAGA